MLREGRFLPDNAAILTALCERLVTAGVGLDRASLHQRALHFRYRGVTRIWRRGEPIEERFMTHGIEKTVSYLESPVRAVAGAGRRLEWRLDQGEALPFATLRELQEEGFTHYVIAPVVYPAGLPNALSWATRRPGGFSIGELQLMDDLLPGYAAVIEAKALRRFVESMLSTYVGHEPSRLILDGQVRRGDIRTITAALMLVDLRNFTLLSDQLSPRAVIRMLNDYFDCVFPAVRRQGGEVMEIMGDGVLAIFQRPSGDGGGEACRAALAATQEALAAVAAHNRSQPSGAPVLQAGAALHYGTVSYGNIGSGDRLDFTVIGPDVNLVSRIEQFCRELDRDLIMSEAFADTLDRPMWELGHFALRGFVKMQRLFTLPPEEE
jgi:adenylate cyclase